MSKTTVIVKHEWVCDLLQDMRKMNETKDFSGLAAKIEQVQEHVSNMEAGLGKGFKTKAILKDKKKDDKEKLKELKKLWLKDKMGVK